jgi:transposase-like protein
MKAANAEYEAGKQHGATLAAIERKHGLTPRSLNNWRSYRMIHQTEPIRRTYLNRK